MRICSDQPCIVLLTEKDVWIRVNGKEPISLKANHMALLNCENNIIDVSSLNNTLVAHISHDIIKDYLRFLNKDLSQIPVWQRSATPILTLPCLTPDVFRVAAQHSMMPAETESEKERTRALLFTVLSRFLDSKNVPIATIGGVLIAAVCYVLSTTAIMGMIPNAALRVSASPFGDAARMALGDTAGAIVSFCAAAGCLGSLGGWTLLAGQTAKAAADDGLFPPIFARVNKAGTPVAGLIIVGILMTIFQLSSISPNATKEFGLVSSVSVIFTLVPYLYTCAALLLLGHGHFGKARPAYLAVTTIAFLYCIWAVVGSGAKEVMWSFVTLMVITAMYALNYNRLHKNPYPLDAPISKD